MGNKYHCSETIKKTWVILGIICILYLISTSYAAICISYFFYGLGKSLSSVIHDFWLSGMIDDIEIILLALVAFTKLKHTFLLWLILLVNAIYIYVGIKNFYFYLFNSAGSVFSNISIIIANFTAGFTTMIIPIISLILLIYYLYISLIKTDYATK